jgi:hypothetical protein
MNTRTHSTAGLLLLLVGAGCAAEAAGPEPGRADDGEGSLRVALQQQASDGAVYYLRDAKLQLTGQLDTLIEVGDAPVLQQALPQGDYSMELLAGWRMERELDDQLEEVDAQLLGDNPICFSIASGEITAVTLRFLVQGTGEIGFETGDMVVDMEVETSSDGGTPDAASGGEAPDAASGGEAADAANPGCEGGLLVINEVDYDQPEADQGEFVELFNPTDCPLATDNLRLELVNGANDPADVYAGVNLSLVGPAVPAGGYLVVGAAPVVDSLADGVLAIATSASIQNGEPDGVLLLDGETVLDSLSYGGNIPGVTETESAPTDTGQGSIGRCENGSDSDDNAADFLFTEVPTPGAANYCAL